MIKHSALFLCLAALCFRPGLQARTDLHRAARTSGRVRFRNPDVRDTGSPARPAPGAKSGSAKPSRPAPSRPIRPSPSRSRKARCSRVLRFPKEGADRRGQVIKAGVYTLRYSNFPTDGAHQGVAPQRDFALATPIANDPDPKATPDFDKLVAQSKTSGTAHAAVFSLEPPSGSTFPAVTKEGEHDTVLNVKVGDLPIAIIVAGKAE